MADKKILIVVTNQSHYPNGRRRTGVWLSELTHFYDEFDRLGYEIDIVSPKGGEVPIDPQSLLPVMLDKSTRARRDDKEFMKLLENTPRAAEVNPGDYAAIYFVGGHGAMWDFPDNPDLQQAAAKIYEEGGAVAAVCHGACGLVNLELSDGKNLVDGKQVTGFSNLEERLALRSKVVPFLVEDGLKQSGASYSRAALPMRGHVVTDGRLVTGQNPASVREVARELSKVIA
jgi:putative intracellular protease/amidase